MARVPAKRAQTKINPMFHIPEGVDELIYQDFDPSDIYYYDTDTGENDFVGGIPTPHILGVIEQTVRTLPSGTQVVDIVLEVEDIPGIEEFEVRVAKI
jgi:hypothetical protein